MFNEPAICNLSFKKKFDLSFANFYQMHLKYVVKERQYKGLTF